MRRDIYQRPSQEWRHQEAKKTRRGGARTARAEEVGWKEENKLIRMRESERRLTRAQLLRAGRGLRREASGKRRVRPKELMKSAAQSVTPHLETC